MCRFFFPSGTVKYVLVWWVFNNRACAFQKRWAQGRERLFKYVLVHIVFFQAHLLQKKRSATPCCLPIKFLSLLLCVHRKTNWKQKAMKSKDRKARTQESYYTRKRPGKNASHFKIGTIFKKWKKWPFCKGYSKAKWSQMVHTGSELQSTKNIHRLPFSIIRIVLRRRT